MQLTKMVAALALAQFAAATPDKMTADFCGGLSDWSESSVWDAKMGAASLITVGNDARSAGQIKTDIAVSEWTYEGPITFVVQVTGARRSAIRIYAGEQELDQLAIVGGTLEGGQGITGIGSTAGKEICRWSEVATTIYKWTPPSQALDDTADSPGSDVKIQIVAIGSKTGDRFIVEYNFGLNDGATVVTNPSGSTTPSTGKTEASGIKCGNGFKTADILNDAAVGANTADGSQVTFSCAGSKIASGPAFCKNGVWSEAKCVTSGASCATAFKTDLITSSVGANTAHNGQVDFTCSDGAVATGKATCVNGIWDDAKCLAKCKIPYYTPQISSIAGLNTPSGTSVTFTCSGSLVASGKATCTNGQWNSPTCIQSKSSTTANPTGTTANPTVTTSQGGGQDAGSHAAPTALATVAVAAVVAVIAGLF